MKKNLKILISIASAVVISGCAGAMPKYQSSKSSFIIFKTPTLKYADMGFISKAPSETKVEIYQSAQPIMRLRITKNEVCMSKFKCLSKEKFNQEILGANYPKDMIDNIFNKRAIFNAQNLQKMPSGFSQKIKNDKFDINYRVIKNSINFIDKKNGVKIVVKDTM